MCPIIVPLSCRSLKYVKTFFIILSFVLSSSMVGIWLFSEKIFESYIETHLFFNFISANEVSERIVSASVTANLIIYLTTKYHLGAASSAIIIFVYQAAANFLPVCGAIVSDALLGRYLMVTLTLFSCTTVRILHNFIQ